MKSFRKLVSEVAQPKAGDEIHFKAKHEIEKSAHPHAGDETFKGGTKKAPKRIADHEKGEDEEVYEAKLDPVGKADADINNDGDVDSSDKYLHARRKAISKAMKKEEAEELDEISKKTLASYIKRATGDVVTKARLSGDVRDKDSGANYMKALGRQIGISRAVNKLQKEEVEQLDELSPNKLHSYIKKAAGSVAGTAAGMGSDAATKGTVDSKKARSINNRMRGISGASGRLADKANMAENWQEEIPMMMRQLEFIAYAAEEIMDYVEMAGDPEEWFQNKISGIHQSMLSMYAYAQGGRRAGYGFDESVELDEASDPRKVRDELKSQGKHKEAGEHAFKHDLGRSYGQHFGMRSSKNSAEMEYHKGYDYAKARAGKADRLKNEEVELDEAAPKMKPDFLKTQREKNRAHDAAMGRTPTGRKKPMTSTQRSMASMRKEESELDEATSFQSVLKAHEYAGKGKEYTWRHGRTKVIHYGDHVVSYNDADGRKVHKTPSHLNKHLNALHDTEVNMRSLKEYFDLDEATPVKKAITRALQGMKVQPKEKVTVKKAPWDKNEEVELDEVTRSAVKRPEKYTDSRGVTRTRMTSTRPVQRDQYGQEKIGESLEEAVKPGRMKLDDGSMIMVSKKDADLVNQMFNDLNAKNRKKMQDTMMIDKAGFEEIVGFAREAL